MINPKLSPIPAKNPPNFGVRPDKITNCEKSTPFHSFTSLYEVTKEKMQTKHFLFTLTGEL